MSTVTIVHLNGNTTILTNVQTVDQNKEHTVTFIHADGNTTVYVLRNILGWTKVKAPTVE